MTVKDGVPGETAGRHHREHARHLRHSPNARPPSRRSPTAGPREDVYNSRIKECDRLEACAENLRALGVPVEVGRDWIEIHPSRPRPAHIACHGDHRIAMAFSITGLRTPGITLDDPGCVNKTFPGFHHALAGIRTTWGHDR